MSSIVDRGAPHSPAYRRSCPLKLLDTTSRHLQKSHSKVTTDHHVNKSTHLWHCVSFSLSLPFLEFGEFDPLPSSEPQPGNLRKDKPKPGARNWPATMTSPSTDGADGTLLSNAQVSPGSSNSFYASASEGSTCHVPEGEVSGESASREVHVSSSGAHSFEKLPTELIDAILGYLPAQDLAFMRQVSKALHTHANKEFHWQRHVLSNLPGNPVTSPYPFETFRELYVGHDPFWFIPKHKLWFSDRGLPGQMIIVQYDERRGVIEGYQLVAVSTAETSEPWLAHQELTVHIEQFEPRVRLHRDKPILKLSPANKQKHGEAESSGSSLRREFFPAHPMALDIDTDPRVGEVVLAKPLGGVLEAHIPATFPYGYVWPPPTIPARHRVGAQAAGVLPISNQRLEVASPGNWAPSHRSEASDQTFRIRRWMEWARSALGLRLGEETVTWSTLDPYYYTPTKEKPWRGIWVGDYSVHGCEFLLVHQPDPEDDVNEPLERRPGETDEEYDQRFLHERVYKGRLEGIKLTGDTNVPRGEHTFIAPDLGERGLVGVEEEAPFEGCRVVKSEGHIAADGFVNGKPFL